MGVLVVGCNCVLDLALPGHHQWLAASIALLKLGSDCWVGVVVIDMPDFSLSRCLELVFFCVLWMWFETGAASWSFISGMDDLCPFSFAAHRCDGNPIPLYGRCGRSTTTAF